MDEETKNRICDFFEAGEFAEYLGISVRDIIEAFPEEVTEALGDLEEIMEYRHG